MATTDLVAQALLNSLILFSFVKSLGSLWKVTEINRQYFIHFFLCSCNLGVDFSDLLNSCTK